MIANLIVKYPQQTVWNMMAISKSSFPIRLQRCQAIFEKAKTKSPALHIYFRDITKLTGNIYSAVTLSVMSEDLNCLVVYTASTDGCPYWFCYSNTI